MILVAKYCFWMWPIIVNLEVGYHIAIYSLEERDVTGQLGADM